MKIVIDVREDFFQQLCDEVENASNAGIPIGVLEYVIANGTPLPKGHGRLIDEKKMLNRLKEWNADKEKDVVEWGLYNFALNRIIESPTIIEADKGGGEE